MTEVWLNGVIVPESEARIAPADRGLLLGDGLFETLRVSGGRPLRLDRHLARLRAGAEILGLAVPLDDAGLAAAMERLLERRGLSEASLRLTLTRGPGPRGLLPPAEPTPTLLITAAPRTPPLPPARVVVARETRRNEHSPLSRIKSLSTLDGVLARQEAARRGADDALLLNTAGRVAEASAANLFLWLDGALVTPPVAEGALPGVLRAAVLEAFPVAERPVTVEDLARTEEAFLTSSLGVRPVVTVDGRTLGDGRPGARTTKIAAAV
ncbi:aminotransferase class IV [Azospirillum sp. TSO22-1]|uniref:aminotransferase class IV n=1 Tax=Azospirillum sp. TSO22-1 TaxID=716789 RepID=UPI000D619FE3|nr:aminotransferase class IV [Azospirillum sp. TSO22-1]PWC43191.1 2-keto-4-methylthiobutyrate aminotransferase [Azospirillum sp. TSO22-1]